MKKTPDREKVINHFQDAIAANGNGNRWRFVRVDIIEDAIELLKEQEPVKPEPYLIGQPEYKFYCCPVCKVTWYYKGNYCLNCGRAVKWDD